MKIDEWTTLVDAYRDAAEGVAGLVAAVGDPDGPGLGEWTALELAAHTMRALTTVEQYLDAGEAAGPPDLDDAAAYVASYLEARRRDPGTDAAVAARGREAAPALGDDPGRVFASTTRRVTDLVAAAPPGTVVATPFGSIRLADYLRTRLMELVIHGLDLASAVGVEWHPPTDALGDTLGLLTEVAVRTGRGEDLACLLGGRAAPADVLPVIR
jgi:uncharacterized protein (TIGR03083 family)